MSGAATEHGGSAGTCEPGRPRRDRGYEPGDGKRGSTRGILITITGALVTAGIATAAVSPGLIGGKPSGPPAAATSKAAETQQSCTTRIPTAPQNFTGQVTGFLTDEQVLAITRSVEAQLGTKVNPAYLPLKHVWVSFQNGSQRTMAAVPEHMSVKIGDSVGLNSRYRDQTLPCHFIPWTITGLVDAGSLRARPAN
jgi:hypothetical protein